MTIYIYSNETGKIVATHEGEENVDCEKWADENWGYNDFHYGYTGARTSNAVPKKNRSAIALGRIKSPAKAKSSRKNGEKGGRPRLPRCGTCGTIPRLCRCHSDPLIS
jgi:hypothetical protein